jgi:MerR family copper efflux transcriptional regulator
MEHRPYNIGEAALASGLTAKMIRHYEDSGLIPKASRTFAGYRLYSEKDVHMLRFIRHARSLGFPLKQTKELLDLWRDQARPSSKVKALAQAHIAALDQKILELNAMKLQLEHLVDCCRGDDRPDCPIIDSLATSKPNDY